MIVFSSIQWKKKPSEVQVISEDHHLQQKYIILFQSHHSLLLLQRWMQPLSVPKQRSSTVWADQDTQLWGRCCSHSEPKLESDLRWQLCLPDTGFVCTSENLTKSCSLSCKAAHIHRIESSQPSKQHSCIQTTDGDQSLTLCLTIAWQNSGWTGQSCLREDANSCDCGTASGL